MKQSYKTFGCSGCEARTITKKLSASAVVLILFLGSFMSCKKNSNNQPTPGISSLSSTGGVPNSSIAITGDNFNGANLSVTFNGVAAKIDSASATRLVVTVPANATTGKVAVSTSGGTVTYGKIFTVIARTYTKIYGGTSYFKSIAVDAGGNIFACRNADTVFKITPAGVLSVFALVNTSTIARSSLENVAVDKAGNVYATSYLDRKVYKISPTGAVSLFAGGGARGHADGQGASASFTVLYGFGIGTSIILDATGNLYVADRDVDFRGGIVSDIGQVRKITPDGVVSTLPAGIQINPAGTINTAYTQRGISATDLKGNTFYFTVKDPLEGLGMMNTAGFNIPDFINYVPDIYYYTFDPAGNMYVSLIDNDKRPAIYKVVYQ